MRITQRNEKDILICSLSGEINIDTIYQLKDAFESIVDSETEKVILNFEKVTYIDSMGMATLAGFSKKLTAKNGALALCCLSPKLGSIFQIVKLGKVFKVFDSEDKALKDM
jgi:stage II sporulation protein AA (anti-sigma F factor antagonist)